MCGETIYFGTNYEGVTKWSVRMWTLYEVSERTVDL